MKFQRHSTFVLALGALLLAGCPRSQVPDSDATAPTLALRVFSDQGTFDATANAGAPVRVAPARVEEILFTATAKDAGGIRWIEVEVDRGTIQGSGRRLRRELTRDQALSELVAGSRITGTGGGLVEIKATVEDFHGNSVVATAQADFPLCDEVPIRSAGANAQNNPDDGIDFHSSGPFNPATGTGVRIPGGIVSVTNLGSGTILLRLFDLASTFGQWSDPLPETLAPGASTTAFNGTSATQGWWIVEYPGGPTSIEVCHRSPSPPTPPGGSEPAG